MKTVLYAHDIETNKWSDFNSEFKNKFPSELLNNSKNDFLSYLR